MSEQQDNIELVKRGYDTYHGKGELGQYLARLGEQSVKVKLNRLLADGDMVVALTEVAVGDQRGHDADVFTIHDGKAVRIEVHGDTALMERIYGTKQHAAH